MHNKFEVNFNLEKDNSVNNLFSNYFKLLQQIKRKTCKNLYFVFEQKQFVNNSDFVYFIRIEFVKYISVKTDLNCLFVI